MNIVQILVQIDQRLEELAAQIQGATGMTPEQAAQLAQAVTDIAALRATVEALDVSVHEHYQVLRTEVDAVKVDVESLKAGVGDLSVLPQI
jgi:dihydrodipicolinate reductase